MKKNNILTTLGLAQKAGKITSGEFSAEKSVKTGKSFLVIVAEDASDNTKKKFSNMCEYYEVPIYFLFDKDQLGHYIGKEFRASLSVNDEGFAESIRKKIDSLNQ